MLKVIESKGATIDAAIESALQQLGKERDEVSVEVMQNPKSGFLGIGKEPAIVKVSFQSSPADKAVGFLEGLLLRFGTPATVAVKEDFDNKTIKIQLSGENMGAVIGRRGDTLDAMQYLTSIVTNRDEEERWRVVVDTENYRERREDTLEELAKKTAQKVLKYKKGVALEPMTPHERRIIHACLQEVEGIMTYSVGSEPSRKVVVAPEGTVPKERKNDGGKRPGNNGQYRRRRKPQNKPQGESK